MTFTSTLLSLALGLLVYFGAYWLALHIFVLIQAASRKELLPEVELQDRGSVVVLVPSHHEGASLVDTVRSLVDQDYDGEVAVEVLVADFTDSSVAALRDAYEPGLEEGGRLDLDPGRPARRITVVAVGQSAKHAKLNHALERVEADFVALLDADHRAHLSWISTAVTVLGQSDAAAVQLRKRPLATSTLAQIWDASFSHVAFELFNLACQRSFGSVSFTGSTAVFRGEILRQHRFSSCITEDTFLSYDYLLAGHSIAYDPRVGSYEEATATIASFTLRRRRWSAGHTHAFFKHLRQVFRSPASLTTRLQVFVLGQFYLVPFAIALFFAVQGLYYFVLFTVEVRAAVLLLSAVLAAFLTLWLSWERSTKSADLLVIWVAVVPHVAMSGAVFYLYFAEETFYFVTSFPFQGQLWGAQAVIILVGLLTYAVAWWSSRAVGLRAALLFAVTVPFVIFFDLLSSLLGLADFALGRREWSRIARRHEVSDDVDASLRERLVATTQRVRSRWRYLLAVVPASVLALVVVNDALSVGPCGNETPLLWDPILLSGPDTPVLQVELDKRVAGDRLRVRVRSRVQVDEPGGYDLRVFEGREQVARERMDRPRGALHEVDLDWPLGWDTRRLGVSLAGPGLQCVVDRQEPTHLIELRDGGLHVNGEPFVVKGIVPTFSAPGIEMALDEGYPQLKRIGVNTARLYHPPTDAILEAARQHHMLLIPQPDASTWDSVDPESAFDRAFYERRWRELTEDAAGEPFVLMLNTGNELEINDRGPDMLAAIRRMLGAATSSYERGLTSYSTFATYVDYPVDVVGINMLDSGPTYWERALGLVESLKSPFYASELGGFVAFFEAPSAELRQWRMWRQSEALAERGALGAVYFASHDNWSQAVPPGGYNDPFSGTHPDDRRGYWDRANEPKPELAMLSFLFADVEAEVVDEVVEADAGEVRVRVSNRRSYALQSVSLDAGGEASWPVGDLAPGQARELSLPGSALRAAAGYPTPTLHFEHRSHHGLRGESLWSLAVPDPSRGPVVLGLPVFAPERRGESFGFTPLRAGEAEIVAPEDWSTIGVEGRPVRNRGARVPVAIEGPVQEVRELEMSTDASTWRPFDGTEIGDGTWFLRFVLPDGPAGKRDLVLAGLAATRVFVRWADGTDEAFPAHPYRETLVDVSDRKGLVTLRMRRSRARYLAARSSPTGEAVPIDVSRPFVFAPRRVEVRRGDR